MDIDAISKNPKYKKIDLDYVEFVEVDDIRHQRKIEDKELSVQCKARAVI